MIPYLLLKQHIIKKQSVVVEEVDLSAATFEIDKIPYLSVSGFPAMDGVKELLKKTFVNQLPSRNMDAINVTLVGTSRATVEFKSCDGEQAQKHQGASLILIDSNYHSNLY